MSSPADDRNEPSLSGLGTLVVEAARRAGVDPHGLRALRRHPNSVWLLPAPLLRELREMHSLSAHIRRAPNSPPATAELTHRLASLRAADRSIRWHLIG